MAKLICITGQDGTGKSTLIQSLSTELSSVVVSSIWDIMEGGVKTLPFKSKSEIDDYLCELTANSRLLFLAHCLRFSLDRALSAGADTILLNAYVYKYFASELALGADLNLVQKVITSFPVPDLVIQLDLNPEIAANRKGKFSKYECGARTCSKENFLEFQNRIAMQWMNFDKSNWTFISAEDSQENVLDKASRRINNLSI